MSPLPLRGRWMAGSVNVGHKTPESNREKAGWGCVSVGENYRDADSNYRRSCNSVLVFSVDRRELDTTHPLVLCMRWAIKREGSEKQWWRRKFGNPGRLRSGEWTARHWKAPDAHSIFTFHLIQDWCDDSRHTVLLVIDNTYSIIYCLYNDIKHNFGCFGMFPPK